MAKVMRKEAWHTQRRDQASGNPLFLSIYPKTRVCFMLSPTPLTLRGALPHNRFSWRRSKRAAPRQQKFLGVTRVFQLTDSSEGYLAYLYRFVRGWTPALDTINSKFIQHFSKSVGIYSSHHICLGRSFANNSKTAPRGANWGTFSSVFHFQKATDVWKD